MAATLVAWCAAGASAAVRIDRAEISRAAAPQPGAGAWTPVSLPDPWDRAKPARTGEGWYRLKAALESAGPEPHAIYIPRAGNQLAVHVNGTLVARFGDFSSGSPDFAKQPLLVPIAGPLLRAGENEVLIRVRVDPARNGGLSQVWLGTESELRPMYERMRGWLVHGSLAVAGTSALLGFLALALWARQRESIYGLFGIASLLWAFRVHSTVVVEPPIPVLFWEAAVATAYSWYIALIALFALEVLQVRAPRANRMLWGYFAVSPMICLAVHIWALPGLWTFWLGVNLLVAASVALVVFASAVRAPRVESVLLALAAGVSIAAGARDWFFYRQSAAGYGEFSITRYVSLLFMLALAWILVDRFARAMQGYAQLNRELARRVAEKEGELREHFERAQARERKSAIAEERQRIMRDMHDGLGAHLVGVLHLAEQPQANAEQIAQHVRACLDDLRLTIDSMEPVDGDLATVLGSLRFRLGSRLSGVGLEIDWRVEELPSLEYVTPAIVQHVQKLALEAITNVLKHAQASRIAVHAFHDTAARKIVVELLDNGRGFEAGAAPHGHGLANMRKRAEIIGGKLSIASGAQGTAVRLELPCSD